MLPNITACWVLPKLLPRWPQNGTLYMSWQPTPWMMSGQLQSSSGLVGVPSRSASQEHTVCVRLWRYSLHDWPVIQSVWDPEQTFCMSLEHLLPESVWLVRSAWVLKSTFWSVRGFYALNHFKTFTLFILLDSLRTGWSQKHTGLMKSQTYVLYQLHILTDWVSRWEILPKSAPKHSQSAWILQNYGLFHNLKHTCWLISWELLSVWSFQTYRLAKSSTNTFWMIREDIQASSASQMYRLSEFQATYSLFEVTHATLWRISTILLAVWVFLAYWWLCEAWSSTFCIILRKIQSGSRHTLTYCCFTEPDVHAWSFGKLLRHFPSDLAYTKSPKLWASCACAACTHCNKAIANTTNTKNFCILKYLFHKISAFNGGI